MADPERLDAVLAALTLPAGPSPDDFQAAWWAWTDEGRDLSLPPGWRAQLVDLIAYGLTRADLAHSVDEAMRHTNVPATPTSKFRYALAVAKRLAGDRHREALGLAVVDQKPDVASTSPYVLTASRHVHRPGCRTLEHVNPWNTRPVPSLIPFVPCSVCL